ncbi:response regulator [Plantactinospora siamensis]|uniref:Transcriptional regulatory protein n=1 Tax=Plantactinospora siamensis TaxID=555372 RepID=A0ABV6P6B2_9ACTN
MIRVLIVDDDFRVAGLHASYVTAAGMTVAAVVHTAAEAVAACRRLRPDLVLLDQYLPDELGTRILPQLEADVIMLTAAADADTVRTAFGRGSLNFLVKPFSAGQLIGRLTAYAHYRAHLHAGREMDQDAVDRAAALLHEHDVPDAGLPKGRSAVTVRRILAAVRGGGAAVTAADVADAIGVSRATAQRYLADLARAGKVELTLRYGTTGRPEHLYRWRATTPNS